MKDSSGGANRRQPAKQPQARGKQPAHKASPKRKRRFDKRWFVFLPALGLIYLAFVYANMAVNLPAPPDVLQGASGIQIYDRNGELIQAFSDDPTSGRVVPLSEMSPFIIDATVSTEDAEYWDHPGVNIRGLARAAYENLAFWENGGFFKGSGGSSITQQLAKNLYIKPEDRVSRSPQRKLRETMMAFELSRRYSKEQILEWYLSNTYYGNGAYGIEAASYRYLNKPPSELTLAEAGLLAGLPQAPNYYNPISNVEAARARQIEVLDLMVKHGLIEQAAMDTAVGQTVVLNEGRPPNSSTDIEDAMAPHFAQYVRELLPALIGQENVTGNLKVTTTLDLSLQEIAVDAITTQLDSLEASQGVTNGALVAMDPASGEILAMVGSHDFFRDDISGQVNNATSLNQPGSTIKPVTYLAAFIEGAEPQWTVEDKAIEWGPNGGTLGNADGWYRGEITLSQALGSSLNVPAVETLRWVGLDKVVTLARRLGVTSVEDGSEYGSAFTLGAFDVSLLDMTYVFSTLANHGEQAGISSVLGLPAGSRALDPVAILRVETEDGEVLWNADLRSVRVAPEDHVYQLTQVLSSDEARSSMFGYNSPLNLGIPAAVKSGSSDETRDAWTIGFTPGLVAGVWVGNANNDPIPGGTSTYTAAPIWHAFMLEALQGQPVLAFLSPEEDKASEVASEQRQPTAVPTISTPEPSPTELHPPPTATPRPGATRTPGPPPTQTARPGSSSDGPPPTPTPRSNGQGNGNGNGNSNGSPGNSGNGNGQGNQ
jgi:membrane peptidoglycan carboxypeptidase